MTGRLSVAALVAANLVPILGVLLWDWDVFLLLLLFWSENVIIGIFGIARPIVASWRAGRFTLWPVYAPKGEGR